MSALLPSMLLQTAALPPLAQPIIIAVAVCYFVVVAAIGAWATRRTRTASDFFVAGQGIGLWPLAIAAMAATLSGFAFIGGPGLVYSVGLGAVFIVLPAALTNSMGAWVLAKRMRLMAEVRDMITVPDAIGARYDSRLAQGLSGVAILIAVVGYMATNALALGLVIDAIFGTGLAWGIWIGTLVTLAYSVSGGILAGVYTDVFQGSLMAVASVLVFLYVLETGGGMSGMSRSILAADPGFLGPWGKLSPLAALSFFFVFGLGSLGQPHVVHKFYMLRDPRRLKWYPLIMTTALFVTLLLYVGVGLAVKALVADGSLAPLARADDATPTFLLRFTPVLLAALVFSSVAAAIMSTVNSFMSIGAAALTHDLPVAFGVRLGDELRWGRISTVVISVVAALVAQASGTLVAFLGIFGWGLFASTLVPALAIGLNWEGATREGAIASIATGLVVTLVFETLAYAKLYTFPAGVTVSGLSLVASLLVFFAVSWLTRAGRGAAIAPDIRAVMEA
ncbi:MAG TPA: sodium/proline symporter [Gemmatimonadaceae bacterium]|nr:sodium/proline symporter [Gemmatimonadaceae bacterium]